MQRQIVKCGIAASALLVVAAAVGWAWSDRQSALVYGPVGRHAAVAFGVDQGGLFMMHQSFTLTLGRPPTNWERATAKPSQTMLAWQLTHHVAGFGYEQDVRRVTRQTIIVIPFWFVCLAGTAAALLLRRAVRRPTAGEVCRRCGYDLRATPERCPECGTIPNR